MPGLYEFCMSGQHDQCQQKDCRCLCHPWAQKLVTRPPIVPTASTTSALRCPKCSKVPRSGDVWCRADGEALVVPKGCSCGTIGDELDNFCGKCGKAFTVTTVPIPEPTFSEEEISALEAKARQRPSDVEVPPQEVH